MKDLQGQSSTPDLELKAKKRMVDCSFILHLDERTRNIFRNRVERANFKSQEKQEENNLRLIDVEKFLLKVTSKRQATTPSMSADRNAQMSYIPPSVIKKWNEANLQKDHINILTGIKKKVPFFSNLNLERKASNIKVNIFKLGYFSILLS